MTGREVTYRNIVEDRVGPEWCDDVWTTGVDSATGKTNLVDDVMSLEGNASIGEETDLREHGKNIGFRSRDQHARFANLGEIRNLTSQMIDQSRRSKGRKHEKTDNKVCIECLHINTLVFNFLR